MQHDNLRSMLHYFLRRKMGYKRQLNRRAHLHLLLFKLLPFPATQKKLGEYGDKFTYDSLALRYRNIQAEFGMQLAQLWVTSIGKKKFLIITEIIRQGAIVTHRNSNVIPSHKSYVIYFRNAPAPPSDCYKSGAFCNVSNDCGDGRCSEPC